MTVELSRKAAAIETAAEQFTDSDAQLLKNHLQAVVQVEFLTIPLYLTAVYSFTDAALTYSTDSGKTTPLCDAQQEVLSVAVQQVLHVQLACNICNSLGVKPRIPQLNVAPGEVITVTHLEPTPGKKLTITIGNLPDALRALIAIEKPATGGFPEPNAQVVYPSIADLYRATLTLLNRYLCAYANVAPGYDPHFWPNQRQVNYATFRNTYPDIPIIAKRTDAGTAANAIIDHGEGGLVASSAGGLLFRSADSGDVLAQFRRGKGGRFARWVATSQYERILDVQKAVSDVCLPGAKALFYRPCGAKSADLPSWAPAAAVLQQCAGTIWSYLTDTMQRGFAQGNLAPDSGQGTGTPGFNDTILAFKYIALMVWQWGHVIGYQYRTGVSGAQAREAMDKADPLSLFHWDRKTAVQNDRNNRGQTTFFSEDVVSRGFPGSTAEYKQTRSRSRA